MSENKITLTKKIAGTAAFASLAFVISLLEFPIFPAAPFLKLDFSCVFILLAGFTFGPVSGLCASAVKELIRFLIGSSTGGVGEIANFIVTAAFIVVPTVVYRFKKGLPTVIVTLLIGCALQIIAALFSNRFINYPLFMGEQAKEWFDKTWQYIVFFNLIKTAAVSVLTVALYKKISGLIKRI